MVINDKLKGEYYRAPITKLASRNNILTTINELIDYFNRLSVLIDENFNKITETREEMKVNLLTIYEKTRHFKYVLEHFRIDVDLHVKERLNDAIENFQNRMSIFVTPYELNLFNHSSVTDDLISNNIDNNSIEDWDRSISILSSELGIRWFGGKISDRSLITNLDNILHITKINTYDGNKYEDYINSNLILDIFLYTPKGIIWLTLGKNGDFGYNLIVKYNSKGALFNLKLLSETYNNRKGFDINVYDFDMILNTLLTRDDIKNGNVYIKVKTNIPSNTESGREGYFLTSDNKFTNHEMKKATSEFARGLMYHDNKDVAYFEHEDENIFDVNNKSSKSIETSVVVNANTKNVKNFETESGENVFYSDISNTIEDRYVQAIYNPEKSEMTDLMDIVSGYIISNVSTETNKEFFENIKMNKKYDNGDPVNYTKGETVVDISDPKFVGDLVLIPRNENMFAIENSFSKSKVVPSQIKYGEEISKRIVENTFTNDESFSDMSNNDYTQDADILLTPIVDNNSLIYKVLQVTDNDILIIKSDGIYRFNSRDKLSDDGSFTVKLNQNNLFNVCHDALLNNNTVYLATDIGICKLNTQTFVIERTGVVGGSWCKLFETFDKQNVIGIRKDFSTKVIDGKISYGESVAISSGSNFNLLRVICPDLKYHTYDNPALDNELTDVSKALDYKHKRNFQEEFKVIPNPIENKYYFFRYGHKMLVTNSPTDPVLKFSNFKVLEPMKDYLISDALMFENKIYFTVYEGGNFVYDINTNIVSPVEYTINKVINNRNTVLKSYYMSKLSNLVNDNSDSTGIVDKYVLLTPEEIRAGYVKGTKYFYPSIRSLHLCSLEERLAGPDPNIKYYGCIGTKFSVIGSWYIGEVTDFNNVDKDGVVNPDMNYGYIEFANDGKYLDYTLAVAAEGFMMDPSKIYKLVQVEEELPKINCFIKVANGKVFFIPNNEKNEITNLTYINGYYYFATNQDYIFKLDENFNIVNQIRSESCNELFGTGNLLIIQNNKTISEEITKTESYYDTVDGSEMIDGYNKDIEYYLEKDVDEEVINYEVISDDEYNLGPRDDVEYYKNIDGEYSLYSRDELIETIDQYNPTVDDSYNPDKTYYKVREPLPDVPDTTETEYIEVTDVDFGDGSNVLEKETITRFKVPKEEIYLQTKTINSTRQMVRAQENDEDFILTPKYTDIDTETRNNGIQDGIDYYITRDLPDKEYYDHIEPEAKTKNYDSMTFNISDYFIGELVDFSSIPEDERDNKPLYTTNEDGSNYVYVDLYKKDVTVLGDINNFYTINNNYVPAEEDDFNRETRFDKVNIDENPTPDPTVSYFSKLDNVDSDTGLSYVNEGQLQAFDPSKEYYTAGSSYYVFKNDNEFGTHKTFFHKRIEDSGVEYLLATKENNNFESTDVYTKVTDDEKLQEPVRGVDYYIHPILYTEHYDTVVKTEDLFTFDQIDGKYYKMVGTPTEQYVPLTNEELQAGPVVDTLYWVQDGGIWVEKQYDILEENDEGDKIFSLGIAYFKKEFDYSNVTYVLCDTSIDFEEQDFVSAQITGTNTTGKIPDDNSIYVKVENLDTDNVEYVDANSDVLDAEIDNYFNLVDTYVELTEEENLNGYQDGETYFIREETPNPDGGEVEISYREAEDSDFDTQTTQTTNYERTTDPTYNESKTYYVEDADSYREAIDSDFTMGGDDGNTREFTPGVNYYEASEVSNTTTSFKSDIVYFKKVVEKHFKQDVEYFTRGTGYYKFKTDIDYYTKRIESNLDTENYVTNISFGSKSVASNLKLDTNNIIQTNNFYTGEDTLFIRQGEDHIIKMYTLVDGISTPTEIFSVDLRTINAGDLLYTNGKLFVFDHGIIIDYLKNEKQTWSNITTDENWSEDNFAVMCGDNVVLAKKITQDGPNKDKWELYYYDYTTRDLQKSTEIPLVNSKPNIIIKGDNIFVEQGNRFFIFNKSYSINITETGVDVTEIKLFNGIVEADSNSSEWDDGSDFCEFITLNHVSPDSTNFESIYKIPYNELKNNDLLLITDGKTKIRLYEKTEDNKLSFINEFTQYWNIKDVYRYNGEDVNNLSNTGLYFVSINNDGSNDIGYLYKTEDGEYRIGTLSNLTEQISSVKILGSFEVNSETYIKTLFLSKTVDTNKDKYVICNHNIKTDTRYFDKDNTDTTETFSEEYATINVHNNYIECIKDNSEKEYFDFNYKYINSGLDIVSVQETYDNTNLVVVKENDRYRIYRDENDNDTLIVTDDYIEINDNMLEDNKDKTTWNKLKLIVLNNNYEYFLVLINGSDLIKNVMSFDENTDYYTKETVYDFFDEIAYYLKSIMVNFNLELTYYTKRIKTIIQNVVQHAKSYTSTDNTSKLYHKSLIKDKANSLKVLMNVLNK